MFFPRRHEPLALTEAGLEGLLFSLNAPVLNLPDLPVGPARAAIAIHRGPDGAVQLTVGVRVVKTGEVVLFGYDAGAESGELGGLGADSALSFGESMGFLFDDNEMAGADPQAGARALSLWQEFVEGAPVESEQTELVEGTPVGSDDLVGGCDAASPADAEEPAPELGEVLLLDELETPEIATETPPLALSKFRNRLGEPLASTERPAAPVEPLAPPEPILDAALSPEIDGLGTAEAPPEESSPASPEPAPKRRPTALGRLKLVRRRLGSRGSDRRSWVTKLLTSF